MEKPKITLKDRFKNTKFYRTLKNNPRERRLFFSILAIVVILGVGGLIYIWSHPAPVPIFSTIIKQKPAKKYYSPLTGVQVADEAATKRQVTAVMIENSPDARPQSGLKDAGVVFETIAEAGITRFVALYQESRPGLIGPVRSVRPYYVEWASTFDPAVAHIGGSSRALDMIRSGNYGVDLDQFFNPGAYWRASDRYAPHNVYTNSDKLDELENSKGKTSSNFTFSPRTDEKKADKPTATHIDLPISSSWYNVTYDYDTGSNSYVRKVGGENHVDRESGQIQPKVVIGMNIDISSGMEDGVREQINTTGNGKAVIFQDGTAQEATWSRDNDKSRLTFKSADGKEIPLVRGQTWITALPNDRNITWQ